MATTAVKIPFTEAAAPATPASGQVVTYAKADGLMYSKDDAGVETLMSGGAGGGSVATDAIWDAAGDIVQGTGANTAARLALGAAGTVVRSTGATNAYAFPPGYEFDYAQHTGAVSITATSEATANTIVTGNAVTYDGSTIVMIEYFAPYFTLPSLADVIICLYDGSTALGGLALMSQAQIAAGTARRQVRTARRLTPTAAAHTYSVRAYTSTGTASAGAGAGGSGAHPPGFIRITKV